MPARAATPGRILKEWPELILERLADAGVARITLNRPEKRNCWNRPLCRRLPRIARHHPRRQGAQGRHHQGRRHGLFVGARPHLPARSLERPDARLGPAEHHHPDRRGHPRLPAHHDRAGARLLPRRRARHHELPRHRVRGRGRAARHAGSAARQFRPARHLDAAAFRAAGEEARADRARRQERVRQGGRRARHHQPGGAGERRSKRTPSRSRATSPRRHLAPLEHHKITVQMGRDLSLSQAIQLDQLVGQRLRRAMDPLGDVEGYLKSQKGGANLNYKRPDVE